MGSGAPPTDMVLVKDLKAGMKSINAVLIVLEVGPPTLTKEAREVRTLRVADATASVNLSVWDLAGALLQPGDIVRVSRGYAAPWRGALTLYSGKAGDLAKVGEFCMLFNDQLNMSEPQPALPQPPPPLPSASASASGAGAAAGPSGPGGADKPQPSSHKTYVRGGGGGGGSSRAHQRNNSRR